MRNYYQNSTAHETNGLPTLFPVFYALLDGDIQGVEKHAAGFFETHLMIPLVRSIFGIVPLESDARHRLSVITFL